MSNAEEKITFVKWHKDENGNIFAKFENTKASLEERHVPKSEIIGTNPVKHGHTFLAKDRNLLDILLFRQPNVNAVKSARWYYHASGKCLHLK